MKLQVAHVRVVRLAEQESVVIHSMESYVVFHLSLYLLAGAVMESAAGGGSASSVAFHLWLVVGTHGVPLSSRFLLEQEAVVCCCLEYWFQNGCYVQLSFLELVYSGVHTFVEIDDF